MRPTIRIAALALTLMPTSVDAQPVAMDEKTRVLIESRIEGWTREIVANPRDYKTLSAIGAAYDSLGHHSEALEFYKRAIAICPTYADAHFGLATTYGFLGRQVEKIAECKEAIRLRPKYAEAHASLGISYGKAGRYPDGIRELKIALDLKLPVTFQADAHFALGLAYASSGQFPAALAEQETLAKLDPERGTELKNVIARILAAALRADYHEVGVDPFPRSV
jgi:tetratricopeptide (TPR) repeat protein